MKNILICFLVLVLAGEAVTLGIINKKKPQEKVLAEATFESPSPTPTLTPTTIPTPTPTLTPKLTPKPTKSPTPTPVPQPVYTSQEINEFINRFSAQYNISPDVLRHIALCESGFNPLAQNLGYAGLYQFGATTWKNLRKSFGEDTDPSLRLNAEEAVQTAAYAISAGKKGIWPNCYP